MTTVYAFTYFGESLRGFVNRFRKKDRKRFTKKNRRFVKIWRAYGVKGVALLSPIIFMPIGGAILVNVLGGKKSEIIKWMWISAVFWGFVISAFVKYGYELIRGFIL